MKSSILMHKRGMLRTSASVMVTVTAMAAAIIISTSITSAVENIMMIPKYAQNNHEQMVLGARLAQRELRRSSSSFSPEVETFYPSRENSLDDQMSFMKNVTAQMNNGATSNTSSSSVNEMKAILIANNAGEQVEKYTLEAAQLGIPVITYDSPLKHGRDAGESLFVSPVDFSKTGVLMADMAYHILTIQQNGFYSPENGLSEGGDFVILSSTPNAANQKIWIGYLRDALASNDKNNDNKYSKMRLVGDEVYYPPIDNAKGYEQITLELVQLKKNGTFPNLSLIMAPTTSGAAAAAKALMEHGHCDILQVSGLAEPAEMLEATVAGCVPAFALFDNIDMGYLAYHAAHALISKRIEGKEGEVIHAGRLGTRVIEADPTPARDNALWVLAGEDFIVYNVENVERAAFLNCIMDMEYCRGNLDYMEDHFIAKYKKKALAILPKVTGMISFVCSSFLVQHILRSKTQRRSPYSRIIVGLSAADTLSSFFGFFLSTWPMPSETWLAYGAAGTTQSCTMQGFFSQLGLCAATLYQASLVTYYFLTIVRGWRKTRVQKWEVVFHVVPCVVAVGTAVAGLVLNLYNPQTRGSMCWIEEYPPYCGESLSCERGEHALEYRWGFLYGFVAITFTWLACVMMSMYYNIRTTEKKARRYTQYNNASAHKQSREVAKQALLYSLAYSIPWIWTLVLSSINTAQGVFANRGIDDAITALNIVNVIIFPLQGFLNVMVYVRPRYLEARKRDQQSSIFLMLWRTLFPNAQQMPSRRFSLFVSSRPERSSVFGTRRSSLFRRPPNNPNTTNPDVVENAHDEESKVDTVIVEHNKACIMSNPTTEKPNPDAFENNHIGESQMGSGITENDESNIMANPATENDDEVAKTGAP